MRSRLKCRRLFVGLLIVLGAIVAVGYFLLHRPPSIRDFSTLRNAWDAAEEREEETGEKETDEERSVRAQCYLEIAQSRPGTVDGLAALVLAATGAPKTAAGQEANRQLAQQIETADMDNLAAALDGGVVGGYRRLQDFAPALLARARKNSDHPKAARLLELVYGAVREAWEAGEKETDEERNGRAQWCLEVAQARPGAVDGLAALLLAVTRAPKTAAGQEAHRQLAQEFETADIGNLAAALGRVPGAPQDLAPALLARARKDPDHPKAARLLATVCISTGPGEAETPPAIYEEAAKLIADKYASSPEIYHFCESLHRGPSWAIAYERHLRAILQVNHDRRVRCVAQFALATVVQEAREDRQAEAEALFAQFLAEFDGKHPYQAQSIEEVYVAEATSRLAELRHRAVGMPAPQIDGFDLDERPMKLSDYRGRVVLLNFWGSWCFPCMKLVPHEIDLVKTFQGQPFVIVGVNCDTNIPSARAAVARTKMTWRSFRDCVDDKPTITKQWKVVGYPCLYLIDHHGTIRRRWIGNPPTDELTHMVRVLVDAARRNVPADAMKPVVAALPLRAAEANPVDTPATMAPQPNSSFVERVYRNSDGSESKYVVFVPRSYDGNKSFPAILYLHGSGSRGTDGKLPIKYGLAKAIRAKGVDFPFIAIFPQAREGEDWTAESTGGKRALAILDQVQADYRINADRVSLTGHSMGGQGTWSLAAADPKRWAAIVPVSHGGDTKSAARLIDIPCWCFHGDADKMIPAQQSREMVQAIIEAGGRPLYQEFIGVGHNDGADRAYALPDLYEWMLLQNRAKR